MCWFCEVGSPFLPLEKKVEIAGSQSRKAHQRKPSKTLRQPMFSISRIVGLWEGQPPEEVCDAPTFLSHPLSPTNFLFQVNKATQKPNDIMMIMERIRKPQCCPISSQILNSHVILAIFYLSTSVLSSAKRDF